MPSDRFRAASADCRLLFANCDEIAGFDGTGVPVFCDERIAFNGKAPMVCEPFEVAIIEFDRRGRSEFYGHCKTQFKPYDLFVKAALIVLNFHLPKRFIVFSDAPPSEWDEARKFVSQRLGYGGAFTLASTNAS